MIQRRFMIQRRSRNRQETCPTENEFCPRNCCRTARRWSSVCWGHFRDLTSKQTVHTNEIATASTTNSQRLRSLSQIRLLALIDLNKNLQTFTAQNNPTKMHCILFLRSDLSDWSDFARSKATDRLDKPAHFRLFQHGRWFASFY